MPVFSGANLIGGLVFGSIGFVAFVYGKRMHIWKPMLIGLALSSAFYVSLYFSFRDCFGEPD